jgi:FixJ family two-component response regulator
MDAAAPDALPVGERPRDPGGRGPAAAGPSTPRHPNPEENSVIVRAVAGAPPVALFVIDGDTGTRASLERLFRDEGFAVQAFDSAESLLAHGDLARPAVLLLDVLLPGMSGLELQVLLHQRDVDVPIVFLSATQRLAIAVTAMQQGAVDFVEKPFADDDLLARVRKAAVTWRPPHVRVPRTEIAKRSQALTPREREVMSLVVAGLTSKEVARKLAVSPRTVEVHRMHLMDKMDATSLAELVGMAFALDDA